MMVNAALFQDMVPAGTGAGSKPGAGGSEPQGGGFAKILSGHAEKESGSASEPQRSRSGAPSRADGSRDLQTRQGDAGEQVARGGEQQQEQPLPSVKELTAQAEAEQQPAADAENAAATAAEGAATPAQPQSRETQVPANGKGATADLKPVWVFDEPQAGAQAVQTEGGKIQLPVATAPAAAAEPAAALLAQQVVPQDAAALQGKLSGPEQKGRSTQESGKKQSGGASDDRAQQSDDSVAALQGGAMLTAFLYGPAASAAGSGTAKAVGTGAEADPVAGIAADATAAGQGKATAPHGEQPQAPVRGEASAVLEALQQKAFALAAQGEPQTARQELRAGGAQSPPQQSAAQQTAAQQTAAQQTAVALTAQHEQAAAPQNQAQFQATQLGAAPLATGEPNLPKAAPQHPESAAAKLPGNAEQSADPGKGEASREPQGAQQVAQNSPRSELTAQSAVITPTPSADADQVRAQDAAAQDPGRQAAAPLSGEKQETLQAVNGRQDGNGVKVAAEPAATEQKTASGGISGIKTATAAAVPHPAAAGNPGQNGSGEGEKGHAEQKAQPQAQPATAGMMQFAAARENSQPAAAPSSTQSALHDSILSQVKDAVVTHDGKGNGEVSIKLNPGELGELKIQVRMDDNRVRVEVQADNKMVKDLLLSNLDTLKDALAGKNFTMEGFDVSTGSGGGFNSPLPEQQREAAQQQALARNARPAAYDAPEQSAVNYMTAEVNSLLDVRF